MSETQAPSPDLLEKPERYETYAHRDGEERISALLRNPRSVFVWLAERGCFNWMKDELYLRCFYRAKMGRKLNLDAPQTLNEKVQWLKLRDRNPLHARLVDKLGAREYIAGTIGKEYLIPLLGVWKNPNLIDFDALPDRFVLKCSHNSGGSIICTNKAALNRSAVRRNLRRQLRKNYFWFSREWLYRNIPPRVLAEAFIGGEDGSIPKDYKFFCFHGTVRAMIVCESRTSKHVNSYYYDREFRPFYVHTRTIQKPDGLVIEKPAHFEEMRDLAERLSHGMPYVRIDLYDTPEGIRFGEFTFFGKSGFEYGYTLEGDALLGSYLNLEEIHL